MKLHLGCGQRYLDGYTNIDFPSTEHTVQTVSVADEFHNLFELLYKQKTIDEIRLHHVFEHFDRATACAFMVGWNSWLKIGGNLRIEVPDFEIGFDRNFDQLIGYLSSWSAVNNYQKLNGKNPIDLIESNLLKVWGDKETYPVKFPLFLRLGRINPE